MANKKHRAHQPGATAAAERKKRRDLAALAAAAAASPAPPPLASPLAVKTSTACRYEKMEALGAGAFGVVYRALDLHTGELVALKCLSADDGGFLGDERRLDAVFADEVRALEACRGLPCVVQPRGACRRDPDTGEALVAMELVEGPSLKDAMRDDRTSARRRHDEGEVRRIARGLLTGAAAMHAAGLMHRDLKPDNVLLDPHGGGVKICDLGRARAVAATGDDPPFSNPVVARNYRAPELLLGRTDYDELIDEWAIGCIVAELLAGGLLFCGDTIAEQLGEVLSVLGTEDIREWSRCPERLPGGCGPTSFLPDLFPSCPELAMAIGRPALSEAGFEVLSGLLMCNPEKRMTAAAALKYRWFEEA